MSFEVNDFGIPINPKVKKDIKNIKSQLEDISNNVRQEYVGQVADRCIAPNSYAASGFNPMMTRSEHTAFSHIKNPKIIIPRWYGLESATGSTATIKASIEYPVGVFTQATFSSNTSILAQDSTNVITDEIPVEIPMWSKFYVRLFIDSTNGSALYTNTGIQGLNDSCESGAGTTDKTMGGSITTRNGVMFKPSAIIAETNKPSVLVIGDSRAAGDQTFTNRDCIKGQFSHTLSKKYANANLAIPGDSAGQFVNGHSLRTAFAQYFTHVFCNYGINDIISGSSGSGLIDNLSSIRALFPNQKYYHATLPPHTTSTDSWVTVGNQTTHANNSNRVDANNRIRNGEIVNADGFFEIAGVMESSLNSGLWNPLYTSDGLHENSYGGNQILATGVISPFVLD